MIRPALRDGSGTYGGMGPPALPRGNRAGWISFLPSGSLSSPPRFEGLQQTAQFGTRGMIPHGRGHSQRALKYAGPAESTRCTTTRSTSIPLFGRRLIVWRRRMSRFFDVGAPRAMPRGQADERDVPAVRPPSRILRHGSGPRAPLAPSESGRARRFSDRIVRSRPFRGVFLLAPRLGLLVLLPPFLLSAACGGSPPAGDKAPPASADGGPRYEASTPPTATPAEPRVCFGKNTNCSQPVFVPAPAQTQLAIDCTDGPDLQIDWTAALGTFDCLLPNCPAGNSLVATRAGHYWAVAELHPPDPRSVFGALADIVGFAALSFDDAGHLGHSATADVRSAIQGSISFNEFTRAIDVAADGSLLWAATTIDKTGIELRRYGPDGKPSPPRLAVPNAVLGHASWGPDGSAVVSYRVVVQAASGAPFSYTRYAPGIAGFDPDGRVIWNQTLLAGFLDADPSLTSIHTSVAGVGADGSAILRTYELRPNTNPGPSRILKLDRDGNVVWARQAPDTGPPTGQDPGMAVLPDGSSLIGAQGAQTSQGTSSFVVEKLDPDGNCTWQATLSNQTQVDAVAFDDSERAILSSAADNSKIVVVFDKRGPTCARHRLNIPGCIPGDGGVVSDACAGISLAAVGHARLFFGVANLVGVATLP